jgi:membrane protein
MSPVGAWLLQLRGVAEAQIHQLVATWLDRLRRHPVIGEVVEFIDAVGFDYARDHGPMYAGALAFYAFLSLVPLLVLLASLSAMVLFSADEAAMRHTLEALLGDARKVIPYIQASLIDDLMAIVRNRRSLGTVGFVALLLAASEVFRGIEFAMARVFARLDHERPVDNATTPRGYLKSKLVFGAFATAVALTLLLLRLSWSLVSSLLSRVQALAGTVEMLERSTTASFIITSVLMVVAFVGLVKVFSHRDVHARFSVVGGLLFCIAFHVAHAAYDLYISRIRDFDAMYGSFAAVLVVLLWMYFCATLLLLCCEVVKWLQRRVLLGPRWPKDGRWLLIVGPGGTPQP